MTDIDQIIATAEAKGEEWGVIKLDALKELRARAGRADEAENKLRRVAASAADMRGAVERHALLVDNMLPKGTDRM